MEHIGLIVIIYSLGVVAAFIATQIWANVAAEDNQKLQNKYYQEKLSNRELLDRHYRSVDFLLRDNGLILIGSWCTLIACIVTITMIKRSED